ncbi:hypothetical protein HHX47_DHR5000700 [Lentinula edodes]|nr:hypothetical protein HHX47_DHR5000700 [Lentinula edodes]
MVVTWILTLSVTLTLLAFPVASDWTSTPFNAPSYPLAVRTPYLSAWFPSPEGGVALNQAWPEFWTGATLGWAGFAKVDGVAYSFLGESSVTNFTKATQVSAEVDGATYQTGSSTVVRSYFISNGKLANTRDTNYRAIDNDWPVFAFARSLGQITKDTPQYAVFSVGHVRDPVIKYIQNNGVTFEGRSYYFWSTYSTISGAITAFLSDYSEALSRAKALDEKLQTAASSISSDYADIVALSMRQTFGATELTISGSPGAWNTDDVLMFIKGNVNTVDIIMPAWPAFMYLNPKLGEYLLLPLLQYQATGQYPNEWAVHDLGG